MREGWAPGLREAGHDPDVWLLWRAGVKLPVARVRYWSSGARWSWIAWLDDPSTWVERAAEPNTREASMAAAESALGVP